MYKTSLGGLCIGLMLSMSACSVFENPNPFDENEVPNASMSFNGTNYNVTSMSAAETDEVTITVNLSSPDVSQVRVDSRFRDGVGGVIRSKTLATLTPVGQVATFKMKVREMGTDATPIPAGVAGTNSIPLEFVAIGGGTSSTRRFTVTVTRPFALLATRVAPSALTPAPNQARNPASASPNQLIYLGYSSSGALSRLTKVDIFRRVGFTGVEEVAPIASKTYPGTSAAVNDSLVYTIPSTDAIGSTIFLRYVATFANNETIVLNAASATGTPRIAVVGNALQDSRTGLQMLSSVSTGISGNNTSYNFATVSFNGSGTDETVKDMVFIGNGFRSGTGNGTTFVPVASNFNIAGATFQTVETAYNAGTPLTSVTSELATNNVFVCRIRNRTGLDQYGVIRIVSFAPNTNPALAILTFDFRSLRP